MLVVALSMLVILVVAGAVVVLAASSAKASDAPTHPWVQRVRAAVPELPVIREDEDLHLRR
ncbi:hypothetical protein ACOACO_18235 [Nocardioides sp. CPCC 205120]|uniref:hypothetical protein n=1 Tax=Nocardioides sp. CPCC 205120 TaxID=3406462 RepID=UPI003B5083E6